MKKKEKDDLGEKVVKDIIVSSFANKYNIDPKTALVAITKFIQDGGSN